MSISTARGLRLSAPRELWKGTYSIGAASSCGMPGVSSSNYDVTADGARFIVVRDEDRDLRGDRIVVAVNRAEELKVLATRP